MLTLTDTTEYKEISHSLKSLSLLKLLSYIQEELSETHGEKKINEHDLVTTLSANAQSFFSTVKTMLDDPQFKEAFLHSIGKLYQSEDVHDWKQYKLTKRETEIAELLLQGLSYKEIAAKLFVSMDTVFSHIRNIYSKIHVHSRSEMAAKFI